MRTTAVVLLCLYAVSVLADEAMLPSDCIDGGRPCGRPFGCMQGFQCINGQCCRHLPINRCSFGEIGSPCPRFGPCRPGYECKRGLCCRTAPSCSSGFVGPACSVINPCKPGYACKGRRCCAVCPSGRKEGERCNLTPGATRCRSGYDCINNLCCASISCSSGVVGPACSVLNPCRPGNVCRGGQCCAVCPIGRREGGRCNLTPGATRCPFGYDCINNLCCAPRKTIGVCPTTIIGRDRFCRFGFPMHRCITDDQCKIGQKCCADFCGMKRCSIAVRG